MSIGRVQPEEHTAAELVGVGEVRSQIEFWLGAIVLYQLGFCEKSARIWSCCAVWHVFGYTRVLLFSELRRRDKQLLVGDC